VTIGLVAVTLTGCDTPSDALSRCIASTEPTILLRELNLPSDRRKALQTCREKGWGESDCRSVYLNADDAVHQCMVLTGFIFLNESFYWSHGQNPYKAGTTEFKEGVCGGGYADPVCYRRAWLFKLTHWWAL
jgi:hypothetical protein